MSIDTPSETAFDEADRLASKCGGDALSAYRRAFALYIDEVDRVIRNTITRRGVGELDANELHSLTLPDPDEELAREIAKERTHPQDHALIGTSGTYHTALATIKRLRAGC